MPLASTGMCNVFETNFTEWIGDVPSGQPTVVLSNGLTLEDLRAAMQHFTHERDWDRFHTPRNLLCALVSFFSKTRLDVFRLEKWELYLKCFNGEAKSKEACQVHLSFPQSLMNPICRFFR